MRDGVAPEIQILEVIPARLAAMVVEANAIPEIEAEPIEIGFNPQFLIEALRVIKTAEFELELGQADRPGLIKSGANFPYVLMPVNLG